MIQSLKKNLIYGKSYYGLEHVSKNQEEVINILEVKNKKSELHIIKEHTIIGFDQINSHVKKKRHAFLVVNDRYVLSK